MSLNGSQYAEKNMTKSLPLRWFAAVVLGFALVYLISTLNNAKLHKYITGNITNITKPTLVERKTTNAESKVINILSHSWMDFFWKGNRPWWKLGRVSINYKICKLEPGMDCVYTNNRSHYNQSEVVLFNIHTLNPSDIPKLRPPGQLWIFRQLESPVKTNKKFVKLLKHKCNASMTYMLNADISESYVGRHLAGNQTKTTAHGMENLRQYLREKISDKTKLVAWFVSHCNTPSARERYVKELSKFIKVDIYGKCGSHRCPKESRSECDSMLENKYKFYLAFENSFCEDYVTEKFGRMLQLDIIPIVLGAADYNKYAPPGTYLDVRNFTSPRELASFLHVLNNRTDLYVEYLMRKRSMVPVESSSSICKLCNYVHNNLKKVKEIDATNIWDPMKLCQTPETFYKNIFNF